MKKKPNWKKSGRVLCCTVTAAMLMFSLAACGDAEEKVPETTQESVQESTQESIPESTPESTTEPAGEAAQEKVFGQVTAIEGNTITLAVAEQPQEPESGMQNPEDGKEPEKQDNEGESQPAQDGAQKPEGTEDGTQAPDEKQTSGTEASDKDTADGEKPDTEKDGQASDGTDAPEGGQPQLTLTGEVKIIIVDDGTLFTINGEEGALSDLAVNDTVTVTMEGDKVISVESATEMPADKQ